MRCLQKGVLVHLLLLDLVPHTKHTFMKYVSPDLLLFHHTPPPNIYIEHGSTYCRRHFLDTFCASTDIVSFPYYNLKVPTGSFAQITLCPVVRRRMCGCWHLTRKLSGARLPSLHWCERWRGNGTWRLCAGWRAGTYRFVCAARCLGMARCQTAWCARDSSGNAPLHWSTRGRHRLITPPGLALRSQPAKTMSASVHGINTAPCQMLHCVIIPHCSPNNCSSHHRAASHADSGVPPQVHSPCALLNLMPWHDVAWCGLCS